VYPSACHSRFSHSLGVFHTARKLDDVIERLKNDAYDMHRGKVAVAAALVHDVGHGPFSHAFEDVMRRLGQERHEATSVQIIQNSAIRGILNEFQPGFADEVATVIGDKVPEDIYVSIVSSQFDADRLDYMRRDRLMTGAQSSAIDFEWLLGNLEIGRVRIGQDDKEVAEVETLVVGNKALLAVEAYVLGLFHLYPNVYYHKTTRGAEKLCGELLFRVFSLVRQGRQILLPQGHPLFSFAVDSDNYRDFSN
jgi:HD superfamily phosphohydrolase